MVGFFLTALLLTATPLSASSNHALPVEDLGLSVENGVLDKNMPGNLLRGLFDQALATLQEYVEVEGTLPSHEPRRAGEFRLKIFPQGKSLSQEHLTAEGSFHFSPDAEQQEFTLRFKSSKHPSHPLPPVTEDVI